MLLPLNALSLAGAAPPWTSLPHGILVQALRLLPRDARARCACVCRAWRDAAADPDALASLWFEERRLRPALNDGTIAQLCARAGAALREVRLDTLACDAITAPGALAALRQGGCAGVQRLVLRTLRWWSGSDTLSAEQAQRLAAACPALEHTACSIRCQSAEDVATACASLPGPLSLLVRGLDAARAASQLPAQVSALMLQGALDGPCVTTLCDALRTNTTLTSLHLIGVGVGEAGATALGDALRANATLKELRLGNDNIGDAGAAALGEALRTNTTLTELHLGDNGIGDGGAASLGEALRTNVTLTDLDFSMNGIGDAGAASLGEALRNNVTLTELNLSFNGISGAGAVSLGEALSTNATLTTLELSHNRIGDDGAASICAALHTNATLTTLNLSFNDIRGAGAVSLGEALRTNATLTWLDLGYNNIGAAGTAALVEALHANTTLTTLYHYGVNLVGRG